MRLFTTLYESCEILPHFLKWYANRGVSHFHVGIWNFDTRPDRDRIIDLSRSTKIKNVFLEQHAAGQFDPDQDHGWMTDKLNQVTTDGQWYVVADLDELHEPPPEFYSFAAWAEKASESPNVTHCYGYFLDRLAADGSIKPIEEDQDIFEQFPIGAYISLGIAQADTRKICIQRSRRVLVGHHYTDGQAYEGHLGTVHHFKWCGNLIEKLQQRRERIKKLGLGYADEYTRILEHLEKNGMKFGPEFLHT